MKNIVFFIKKNLVIIRNVAVCLQIFAFRVLYLHFTLNMEIAIKILVSNISFQKLPVYIIRFGFCLIAALNSDYKQLKIKPKKIEFF